MRPSGFTLVEVVLSMGLVAMAVLTIAALLPAMFKTQQIVRLQTYAATHAMTISNAVAQGNPRFPGFTAAVKPNSDVSTFALDRGQAFARMPLPGGAFSRPSFADVEQIITGNGKRYAMGQTGIPIPLEIVRRIDSDNDEIQTLLSDGGYLFYPPPGSFSGFIPGEGVFNNDMNIVAGTTETDADRRRLVFAVIGKPQQNLLPSHPCYNLPIYKLYPFPPDDMATFKITEYVAGTGLGKASPEYGRDTTVSPNPVRTLALNTGEIASLWRYFYEQSPKDPSMGTDFDTAWLKLWSESYPDYLSLSRYGWTPIAHKLKTVKTAKEKQKSPNVTGVPTDPVKWAAALQATDETKPWGTLITQTDWSNTSPEDYYKTVKPSPLEIFDPTKVPTYTYPGDAQYPSLPPPSEPFDQYPDSEFCLVRGNRIVTRTEYITEWRRGVNKIKLPWRMVMAPFDPLDIPPYDGTYEEIYDHFAMKSPFKKGDGINENRYREPEGLPSLEMRRYYRRMALILWMRTVGIDPVVQFVHHGDPRDESLDFPGWQPGDSSNIFEQNLVTRKNPLTHLIPPKLDLNRSMIRDMHDLSGGENWRYPHPARIYALTFLAHAAMLVTGARGPMIKADGGYDSYKLGVGGKVTTGDPMEIWDLTTANSVWGMNSSTMAWWYCDLNQNHPGLGNATSPAVFDDEDAAKRSDNQKFFDGAELLQEDIQFARMAHENCMRWIMAYASENPNDLCCPRPANRQSFMDRPLWCADLFPGGLADRGGSAAPYFTMDEKYYRLMSDRESRLAPIFTGKAPIIVPNDPAPRLAPSWDGFHRAVDPKWSRTGISTQLGAVGSFHRSTDSGHDQGKPWLLNGADGSDGAHFNRPFAASERSRELVFWSVDWMNYEDAESAPSAPFDTSFVISLKNDGSLNGAFNGNMYGNPEAAIKFLNPDHTFAGSPIWSSDFGQFGADRNGSGRFDRGSIPASQRMRATTIARFNLYDPVGPCGLRQ